MVYVAISNPIPKQIWKCTLASGVQEVAVSHVGKVAIFFNGAAVFFFEMSTERVLLSHLCTLLWLHAFLIHFFFPHVCFQRSLGHKSRSCCCCWVNIGSGVLALKVHVHTQGDLPCFTTRVFALFCLKMLNILAIVILYMKINLGSDLNLSLGISVKSKLKSILN